MARCHRRWFRAPARCRPEAYTLAAQAVHRASGTHGRRARSRRLALRIDWGSTTHHGCGGERFGSRQPGVSPRRRGPGGARPLAPGRSGRHRDAPRAGPRAEGRRLCGVREDYVSSGAKDGVPWQRPSTSSELSKRPGANCINELTCQRTRLSHQIRQQLWRYYPQLLAIPASFNQLTHPWFRLGPKPPHSPSSCASPPSPNSSKSTASGDWPKACGRSCTPPRSPRPRSRRGRRPRPAGHTPPTNSSPRQVRELLKAFSQAHPDDERPDDTTILRSLPGVGGYVLSTLFAGLHRD